MPMGPAGSRIGNLPPSGATPLRTLAEEEEVKSGSETFAFLIHFLLCKAKVLLPGKGQRTEMSKW